MLAINEILQGRYRITRQLGHGGMGAVYEAIDERFGEPIALKEILTEPVSEKQKALFARAFEREAKSLAKARHEAVPFVRDYFSELDRQFLVMELVEGDDLSELLEKRKNPFSLEEVLQWLDQLLDALDYLHNLTPPIIHRDIKPQNLKLNYRRKIKLLDFGIAKNTDNAAVTSTTNQTFVGATLNYSPNEQILRVIDPTFREFILLKHTEKAERLLNQYTDARCDIYSLGATFYHLLTNHLPVDSIKRTLEIWEDKNDPLLHPGQLNSQIPAAVSECLMKALELDRDDRFSSAIEMQEALQAAIRASAKVITAENVSGQTEPERLPVTEENALKPTLPSRTPDISAYDRLKTNLDGSISSDTLPLPTQPSIVMPLETNVSAEFRTTEPFIPKISDIPPADESFVEEIETGKGRSFSWALPLIAVAILAVGGIAATFWLLSPAPANSADSVNSVANSAAQPSPSNTQTSTAADTEQTPALVEFSDEAPGLANTAASPETSPSKPSAKNTPIVKTQQPKQPVQTTVRPAQTPKPKPKKTSDIGPCAFTDNCK